MRLEPIEKPRGLILRIAYWMSRRTLMGKGLSLDAELELLIMTQSSFLNGCTFCADLHQAQAAREKLGLGRFAALLDYETSEAFSEREIVEITWLNALGNFFNLMAVPLQLESDDLLSLALERGA